ncbi:penicillin-binding protein 2 [Oryzobacter sp. R7]|uniref:penicillin-binding protein 2 n=1 Tax=Oryzobacter faecalis TaxID=3388656 RepID=UPI00398D1AB0
MTSRGVRAGRGRRDRGAVPLHGRFLAVVLLVVLCFGTLVGRLGQVQLVGHTDFVAVTAPDTRTISTPALRGRILDREGRALADNRTSTVVTLERRVVATREDRGEAVVREVAGVLGLDPEPLLARTWLCGEQGAPPAPACWAGSAQVPIPLAEDVDATRALTLIERPDRFPGVAVTSEAVRVYPRPLGANAAHVIGYLGPARSEEVGDEAGITADTLLGRAGLEQQYDEALRGTPGRTVVEVDPRGLVTQVLSRTDPVPGRDVVTSLDARVQVAAERALATEMAAARKRGWPADTGAVVVMEPRSGAVTALASAPTYDPNVWTGGISAADYARLTDPRAGTPLLSRAVGVELAPASTIKPASIAATVRAGNPLGGRYDCPAVYRVGNRAFHNYETRAHGSISLRTALAISCDTVFYEAAYDAWRAQGGGSATTDARDPFITVTTGLGLGRRTGIDLPGEATGRIPGREWKRETWEATRERTCERARTGYPEVADAGHRAYLHAIAKENCVDGFRFRAGDAVNFSIGQGDVSATPLQMAVMYAALANGGTVLTPRVAQRLVDPVDGRSEDVAAGPSRTAPIPAGVGRYLRSALREVAVSGTVGGKLAALDPDWSVAGKTGTAEVQGRRDTSWFVSYAPASSPRYVVAAVVTQGGTGGSTAMPVARSVHEVLRTLR